MFVAVARDLSFRAAARRLGVRLFDRTTRSVGLTPAGDRLFGQVPRLLAALDGAVDEVVAMSDRPSGVVRLNLSRVAAELVLAPLLARFARAFPAIALDLTIDDGLSDIVARGHDAGIRVGGRLAQDMIAARLTPDLRCAVVGTPGYFETRPTPAHPRDLLQHDCLNYRWRPSEELYRWRFEEDGRSIELSVAGSLTVDDTGILREAALAGMGLACLPDLAVAPLIASGRLTRVLEAFCPAQPGFFLYYPSSAHPSAASRAFIDFLRGARPDP